MWIASADEAVVMFARYCRARFGKAASQRVRARAKELRKRGDIAGHDIWNKVAEEIEQGTRSRQPPKLLPPTPASIARPEQQRGRVTQPAE